MKHWNHLHWVQFILVKVDSDGLFKLRTFVDTFELNWDAKSSLTVK